jgi:hypothetical protein
VLQTISKKSEMLFVRGQYILHICIDVAVKVADMAVRHR